MEVTPCLHKVKGHAASLLAHLNLQREQAQFCDCVLRQRQSPGQLYPAHRCVLAASSPVLASILSSTGALVELHAPCLSDSVLALLLDYVYTGALPFTHSQCQYFSLLTAACYLQMDELQQALRAWQQTGVNTADNEDSSTEGDNQLYKDSNKSTISDEHSASSGAFKRQDIHIMPDTAHVLEREAQQYSVNMEISDETQLHSVSIESCNEDVETGTSRTSSEDAANHYSRTNAGTCRNGNDDCRQVTSLPPHSCSQDTRCTNEVDDVCGTDKDIQKDQFYSAGIVKPEVQQKSTEVELVRSPEYRSSSSSSSSSHSCCGAVPVICHSSRAAIPQLVEAHRAVPDHPTSKATSKAPASQLTCSDDIKGIPTKHEDQHDAQNEDYRYNRSYFRTQNNEYMENGFRHLADYADGHASVLGKTQLLSHDSIPQKHNWSKGTKHGADCSFDDFPIKHKKVDCFESLATTTEEHDGRGAVTIPVVDTDTGSDSHCENLFPDGETQAEDSYRCLADIDIQERHCTLYGTKPNMCGAEISTTDANTNQHEYCRQNRHTDMENKECVANVCQPVSHTSESSLDNVPGSLSPSGCHVLLQPERIPGANIAFTTSVDTDIQQETTYGAMVNSYHGHLHYHCLQENNTHPLYGGSEYKHSQPYPSDPSDESSNEDEVGTPGSLDQQHCATDTTEQVLLLDISTKPAELLVTCKHTSDTEEVRKKGTFETEIRKQDRAQRAEMEVEMKITTPRVRLEVDETEIKSWDRRAQSEERKLAGKAPKKAGAQVIQRAPAEGAVSAPKERENQISTWTACSQSGIPDSVQASVSSSLSVCIPSTLSASTPTNISARLSTPVHHPFQCSLCDRSFSQRGSLNRHVRSHLGVRPFPCPRCPMTFSRQYRVTEHMRVHQRCTLGNDFQTSPDSAV